MMPSLKKQLENFLKIAFEYSKVEAKQSLYLFYSPKYIYPILELLDKDLSLDKFSYNAIDIFTIGKKIIVVIPEHHRVDEELNLYNEFIKRMMKNFKDGLLLLEGLEYELTGKSRLEGLEGLDDILKIVDIKEDLYSERFEDIAKVIVKENRDVIIIKVGIGHIPEVYEILKIVRSYLRESQKH